MKRYKFLLPVSWDYTATAFSVVRGNGWQKWEFFIVYMCVLLSFYTVRRILTVSILEWFAFPSPVDHVFSEVSTMTGPSWVVLHGMAHSFTELHKPLHHDRAVIHEGENYHMTLKILLLGIFPKKSMIWKDTYTPVLAEALFIRAT